MSRIQIQKLTFGYEGSYDNVFEDVSFTIDTDWKLGFIGRNGRGKTTFLQLLMGKYNYRGSITASVDFSYFPYTISDTAQLTVDVAQEVNAETQLWQLKRELAQLGVSEEVLYRPFDTLSNGEQTKVMLAILFLRENGFLLIDEPTNHLDSEARQAVSAYLNRKHGFILVSHDRVFLDACVDHILSINRADITLQRGNFSSWWENKNQRDQFETEENERLKKDMKRLEQAAQRTSSWSDSLEKTKFGAKNAGLRPDRGYIGHKSAKLMKRAKNIEARREAALQQKSALLKNKEEAEELKITTLSHHSAVLAELRDISIRYGTRSICSDVQLVIRPGERIALCGKNGSGKSSLLKLIRGETIAHSGYIHLASGITLSYVPQDTSFLAGDLTRFASERELDVSLFKAILRKLDFSRTQFDKDMHDFSAGQKKKVLVAASLCKPVHLYLWDEPLNYIDIFSRMQIEQMLLTYRPTMLFVEHDQAFIDKIATQTVVLPPK